MAATAWIDSTIPWYPVQRQRLPRSAWRMSFLARRRVAGEQVGGGEDHARCAEPALQAVMLDERALERVHLAVACKPFDRGDLAAVGLMGEDRAALHSAPVEEDGARAALARVAADVRSRQPEAVAQRVDEKRAALDLERALLAVDDERDGVRHQLGAWRACRAGTRGTAEGRSPRFR